MRKDSVQHEAVQMEGRLALDLAAASLHAEVGTCWSFHWENHILVGTTALQSFCSGEVCAFAENLISVGGTGSCRHWCYFALIIIP